MPRIYNDINLNMSDIVKNYVVGEIVQNDSLSSRFMINLYQGKKKLDLTDAVEITVTFLKPDGTDVIGAATVVSAIDGSISYEIPQNALDILGVYKASVEVYDGVGRITFQYIVYSVSMEYNVGNPADDPQYPILLDLINTIEGAVGAEDQRVVDENIRLANEAARIISENARISSETSRGSAETARASAESSRVTVEAARVTAESARASAETTRGNNESTRVSQESSRVTVEAARVTAESGRSTAEGNRVTAETARAGAETTRGTAETTRINNESARGTAESARSTAETNRASAESSRVTAETARSGAETTRASQESTRQTQESARQTAIANLVHRGAYDPGTTYAVNNEVSYGGSSYVLYVAATAGTLPTDTSKWRLAAQKGADGIGAGDMLETMYDPTGKHTDAFNMENMVQGTNKQYITPTQKSNYDAASTYAGVGHVPLTQKGAANGVATLGADQKIPTDQLPALAITDTFAVNTEVAQLALSVEKGDVAVRTDQNKSYINVTGSNDTMADWQELLTPTDTVLSVNTKTGAVSLTGNDIPNGTINKLVIACSDTAASDTYTATVAGYAAYTAGDIVLFKATTANTTSCTLDINALGAKAIVRGTATALLTGDITAGKYIMLVYNGTSFELLSQGVDVSQPGKTETLTNKTLTAPKFANAGYIADTNSNELIKFVVTTSAVNEISVKNAATTTAPEIQATGGDTNIDVKVVPKGSGKFTVEGNTATYTQTNVKNANPGTSASSDVVATADTGTDTTNYVDMGINSSTYADAAYTIMSALSSYLYAQGGDLAIGTGTAAKVIKFFTGGTLAANERMRITDTGVDVTGAFTVNGAAVSTDLTQIYKEISNLKLYQTAGQRIKGTDVTLYGTDFTTDLEVTRNTTNGKLKADAASGQNTIKVPFDCTSLIKKEITIEQGSTVNRKVPLSQTSNAAGYGTVAGSVQTAQMVMCQLDTNLFAMSTGTAQISVFNIVNDAINILATGSAAWGSITKIERIDANRFLVVYPNTASLEVWKYNGPGSITIGTRLNVTEATAGGSNDGYISACVLRPDGTKCIGAYRSSANSDLYVFPFVITDTTLNSNTSVALLVDSGTVNHISIAAISPDYAIVAYVDSTANYVAGIYNNGNSNACVLGGSPVSLPSSDLCYSISAACASGNPATSPMKAVVYAGDNSPETGRAYTVAYSGGGSPTIPYTSAGLSGREGQVTVGLDGKAIVAAREQGTSGICYFHVISDPMNSMNDTSLSSTPLSGYLQPFGGEPIAMSAGDYQIFNNGAYVLRRTTATYTVTLDSNLDNSFTGAVANVYRSDDNSISNGETKDIRLEIAVTETQKTLSAILTCTKGTGLTYSASACIVDSAANESYVAMTQADTTDFGNGTQEIIFTKAVATAANKVTLKITVTNASGATATITKVIGGAE